MPQKILWDVCVSASPGVGCSVGFSRSVVVVIVHPVQPEQERVVPVVVVVVVVVFTVSSL